MTIKAEQYGCNGLCIVGRFTRRLVAKATNRKEAKEIKAELEKYTWDTHESFKGFYGG